MKYITFVIVDAHCDACAENQMEEHSPKLETMTLKNFRNIHKFMRS